MGIPGTLRKTSHAQRKKPIGLGMPRARVRVYELDSGRLVVPCDHIEATSKKYFSHVILSDDGGISWFLGGTTPQDQVNECEVVQLDNGNLLLNMRNYDRNQRARAVCHSDDEGLSWSRTGAKRRTDRAHLPSESAPFRHARGNKAAICQSRQRGKAREYDRAHE